jgi:hypothetical protein
LFKFILKNKYFKKFKKKLEKNKTLFSAGYNNYSQTGFSNKKFYPERITFFDGIEIENIFNGRYQTYLVTSIFIFLKI